MSHADYEYLTTMGNIYHEGINRGDRTGTGTRALFGQPMEFDFLFGFPIVSAKRVPFNLVLSELLWFLSGSSDIRDLHGHNNHIWDGNTYAEYWQGRSVDNGGPKHKFDAGRNYGVQWRDFNGVDQIQKVVEGIRSNPEGRRHVVSAWNPPELNKTALPPCHILFQFFVNTNDNELSMSMYQRSCDMFLGVPFNISSYAALLAMVAQVTGYKPRRLFHVLGDAHIYNNHLEQTVELLSRPAQPDIPSLEINPDVKEIDDFTMDDFKLKGYNPKPTIKAEMAV